jgi:hypothetical protein
VGLHAFSIQSRPVLHGRPSHARHHARVRTFIPLGWSACILTGAALLKPTLARVQLLAFVASFEAVHIVAHTLLYGGLAALGRWAGLSRARAGGLAIAVGALQETVELVAAGRGPRAPELFDLCVDSCAIVAALTIVGLVRRRRSKAGREIESIS